MKARTIVMVTATVLLSAARSAPAQMGEVQLGATVSYGAPDSFGRGLGAVAGLAAGRLAYIGVRVVYHHGGSHSTADAIPVTNRAREIAADLGVMVPFRNVDIVPEASLGVLRFSQTAPGTVLRAKEFFVAPGCALHVHAAGLVFIPEVQIYLPGSPDLPYQVSRRGAVGSLRIVIPFEVRRIRV